MANIDWYERRAELLPEMIFRLEDGDMVKLDRRVPGDGTQWYAANWIGHWSHDDYVIEPADLVALVTEGVS